MKIYLSKYDAIHGLHKSGYTYDFEFAGNDLLWIQEKIIVRVGEFVIEEYHQFNDPVLSGAGVIVFGLVAPCHGVKGILIRHYTKACFKAPPVILKKMEDLLHDSANKIAEVSYLIN